MSLRFSVDAPLAQLCGLPFCGHRHLGMPYGGPADGLAHALANWLCGNEIGAATLEITLAPIELIASTAARLALVGAAQCTVNGHPVDCSAVFAVRPGDRIGILAPAQGCRSYLAIAGGFRAPLFLGSRSTLPWAGIGKTIEAGDVIDADPIGAVPPERRIEDGWLAYIRDAVLLRCVEGPEFDWLDRASQMRLFTGWHADARMDRRGMALAGEALAFQDNRDPSSMPSSATFPGTIQCPPHGQPYLLGQDSATTGGYPRIAQVIRADRHLCGQIRPGTHIHLTRARPDEAARVAAIKHEIWRPVLPDITFG